MNLSTSIEYVPGIGPKKAAVLIGEMSVRTVGDLLSCYPYKYVDRSRFYMISECTDTMSYIQLRGKIVRMEKRGEGRSLRLVAVFTDGRSFIDLVWFKGLCFVEE